MQGVHEAQLLEAKKAPARECHVFIAVLQGNSKHASDKESRAWLGVSVAKQVIRQYTHIA